MMDGGRMTRQIDTRTPGRRLVVLYGRPRPSTSLWAEARSRGGAAGVSDTPLFKTRQHKSHEAVRLSYTSGW